MNEPRPPADEHVDELVRAYLHQQGARTDPHAGLQRVRATLAREAAPSRRSFAHRRSWLAAAAVLLAVVGAGVYLGSGRAVASPEQLIRQARQAHALPVDRCYRVEWQVESDVLDQRHALWTAIRQTRLWTRVDRFALTSGVGNRLWHWGRDEERRLWLAFPANWGIRYEPNETPEALDLMCDVCSMQLDTLLGDVLADFDLHLDPAEPGFFVVRAEPKPGRAHPTLRGAKLTIAADTMALQRIELSRKWRNRAMAQVVFTLIDSQTLPDEQYQLEGHLTPPYQIYSRNFEPQRRRQLLLGRFGQRVE